MANEKNQRSIQQIIYDILKDHWGLIAVAFTAYAILLQTIYYMHLRIPLYALATPTEFIVLSYRHVFEAFLALLSYGIGILFGSELADDLKETPSAWQSIKVLVTHALLLIATAAFIFLPEHEDTLFVTGTKMLLIGTASSTFAILTGGADRDFYIAPTVLFLLGPIFIMSEIGSEIRDGKERSAFILPRPGVACFRHNGEDSCETDDGCMRFAGETGKYIFYWDVKQQEAIVYHRSKVDSIRYLKSSAKKCERSTPEKSAGGGLPKPGGQFDHLARV